MKKYIFLLILPLLGISFSACEDSLGLDPAVQKTIVGPDSSGTDTNIVEDTRFSPREIEWAALEVNYTDGLYLYSRITSDYSISRGDILLDTADGKLYLWIDTEIKTREMQNIGNIPIVLSSFRFRTDTLDFATHSSFNTEIQNSLIELKNVNSNQYRKIEGNKIKNDLFVYPREDGKLYCEYYAVVLDRKDGGYFLGLRLNFTIHI